jgi:hypothetical protein
MSFRVRVPISDSKQKNNMQLNTATDELKVAFAAQDLEPIQLQYWPAWLAAEHKGRVFASAFLDSEDENKWPQMRDQLVENVVSSLQQKLAQHDLNPAETCYWKLFRFPAEQGFAWYLKVLYYPPAVPEVVLDKLVAAAPPPPPDLDV